MVVTSLPGEVVPNLMSKLQLAFPSVEFISSDSFYWSPRKKIVHFVPEALINDAGNWSLLHELGHALLEHQTYISDFELVKLELAAWEKAKVLAKKYDVSIPEEHIQDCLDSYREWLYLRSTCPTCMNSSQQIDAHTYSCFNCNTNWNVSRSRQCRSYRRKALAQNKRTLVS